MKSALLTLLLDAQMVAMKSLTPLADAQGDQVSSYMSGSTGIGFGVPGEEADSAIS